MDLDDLKKQWNKNAHAGFVQAKIRLDTKKIDAGIKSLSLLGKILSSLRWEIAFAIAFGLGCISMAIVSNSIPFITFLVLLSVYSCTFTIYLFHLYKKASDQVLTTGTVVSSISGTIEIIEKFIRLYLRLSTSFVPAIFLAALVAGMVDFYLKSYPLTGLPYLSILLGMIMVSLWIYLMKKFTAWWLHRLYGNYLLDLKGRFKELTDEK